MNSEKIRARKAALWRDRSEWETQWRDTAELVLPRAGIFVDGDTANRSGRNRWSGIYDSGSVRPLRILAAGMMSGLTSPARPWFRLTTPDPALMEYEPVKLWLETVTKKMRDVFMRSNTYRSLHSMYEELGAFGTAACPIVSDYDTVINCHPLTIGEYALAADHRGRVNTIFRQFELTTEQLVQKFGLKNCSTTVQNDYTRGDYFKKHKVVHAVEPRRDADPRKRDGKNKPWASIYYEENASKDLILSESGFSYFPSLCPRWVTTGQDVYGTSPGMEALGDARQLQHEQFRKAQVIDLQTKPPLTAPSSFKNLEMNMIPGGITYGDTTGSGQNAGVRPAFESQLNLSYLLNDIQDVRDRINAAFYADLFLMLANDTRSGITAREVAERHEEKMLMLGPVLERLHNEMLDPLIDFAFNEILNASTSYGPLVPPPPEELQGMDLRVELISTLAQAQRAAGIGSIDRLIGTVGMVAQIKPETLDKIDGDQLIDVYSDMLGVDPSLIVGDERVAIIRKQRADEQVQQQQLQTMAAAAQPLNQVAQAARSVSQAAQGMQPMDPTAGVMGYS